MWYVYEITYLFKFKANIVISIDKKPHTYEFDSKNVDGKKPHTLSAKCILYT